MNSLNSLDGATPIPDTVSLERLFLSDTISGCTVHYFDERHARRQIAGDRLDPLAKCSQDHSWFLRRADKPKKLRDGAHDTRTS